MGFPNSHSHIFSSISPIFLHSFPLHFFHFPHFFPFFHPPNFSHSFSLHFFHFSHFFPFFFHPPIFFGGGGFLGERSVSKWGGGVARCPGVQSGRLFSHPAVRRRIEPPSPGLRTKSRRKGRGGGGGVGSSGNPLCPRREDRVPDRAFLKPDPAHPGGGGGVQPS